MADLSDLSDLIKQLIGGSAPGQTIKRKPEGETVGTGLDPGTQAAIDLLNEAAAAAASRDDAAAALTTQLGFGNLAVAQGQLGVAQGTLALAQETQAFEEQESMTDRLLKAAGLATGPTGAIQLAYLARGEGAPQEEVASIFQNLPFVQELLHGQNVPGFGLPEQLGGESPRVSSDVPGAIEGEGLGVTLPGKKSITRQAFGTLSQFEQLFLGALGQSETGQDMAGFLQDVMKSFIPTRPAGAVSIG